ncbi:hypothetical protein LR68_02142 [Anoxybacillus sp. BCO1]|nr:hypothetical protein LR68_02142 [Anoxybacillus sp. BCO1]
MFDPTIFDNLKTVVEGAVYDLDTNDELIAIIDRSDIVDLAKFTRAYALSFQLRHAHQLTCTISLEMTLQHIANELLHEDVTNAGCTVTVSFSFFSYTCRLPSRRTGAKAHLGGTAHSYPNVNVYIPKT